MSMLERFCISKDTPLFTPYGYVITEDGMIHSLTKQSCHGVVLALLFPELAEANGYDAPDKDACVFHYQRFELDHSRETTVIRISFSLMGGEMNVSKGKPNATPEQVDAIIKIAKECGLGMNDKVQSDLRETTLRSLINDLRTGQI